LQVGSIFEAQGEKLHQNSGPSYAAITKQNLPSTIKSITKFDSRLDQIEQDALSTTLKLGGNFISRKIDDFNKKSDKNHQLFNKSIISEVNKISPDLLSEDEVDFISIVGREKKHLKVKLNSSESKINILKSFKSNRPIDFFASQYLSKSRSWSLYKLKKIKSLNSTVKSVYCYSGSICCQFQNSDKVFHLNNSVAINQFILENNLTNE